MEHYHKCHTSTLLLCQCDNCFDFSHQCIDAVGFNLFLKTYLEVDVFPADFCEHLFRYFQHVEQDGSTKSPLPQGGKSLCASEQVFRGKALSSTVMLSSDSGW